MDNPIFNNSMDAYDKLYTFGKKMDSAINKANKLSPHAPKKALHTLESFDKNNFLTKGDKSHGYGVLDYKYELKKFESPKSKKITPNVIKNISSDLIDNKTQNDESFIPESKYRNMSYKQRLESTERDARDNKEYDQILAKHPDSEKGKSDIKGWDKDLSHTAPRFLDHHPNLKLRLGLKTGYNIITDKEGVATKRLTIMETPNKIRKDYTKPFEKSAKIHINRLKSYVKTANQVPKLAHYLDQHPDKAKQLHLLTGKQIYNHDHKRDFHTYRIVSNADAMEERSEDTDWSTKLNKNQVYEHYMMDDPLNDTKSSMDYHGQDMLRPIQPKHFDQVKKQVPKSIFMDHDQQREQDQIHKTLAKGLHKQLNHGSISAKEINSSVSSKLGRSFHARQSSKSPKKSVNKARARAISQKRNHGIQR